MKGQSGQSFLLLLGKFHICKQNHFDISHVLDAGVSGKNSQ